MAYHLGPPEARPGRARRTGDRLPLVYTPNLLGGLGGQVTASQFPSSWSVASRIAGQGTVLFLPWHEYFHTPFTDHRMIANPAAVYFDGTVITSQNPGPGYGFAAEDPEHVFLDKLLGPPLNLNESAARSPASCEVRRPGEGGRLAVLRQVGDKPGFRLRTRARRWTSSRSGRPPPRYAKTTGSAPSTPPTTGSFPALRVLSACQFPTHKAGRSTAIPPSGSQTGKRVCSPRPQAVSFVTALPRVFGSEADPSRRAPPLRAPRSSSGEGGKQRPTSSA